MSGGSSDPSISSPVTKVAELKRLKTGDRTFHGAEIVVSMTLNHLTHMYSLICHEQPSSEYSTEPLTSHILYKGYILLLDFEESVKKITCQLQAKLFYDYIY